MSLPEGASSGFSAEALAADLAEARRLRQEGRPAEAEAIYLSYVRRGIVSFRMALGYADLLREQGRDEEALAWFRRAQGFEPTLPALYDHCAALLARLRRYDEALAMLQRGLQLEPDSVSMLRNLGLLLAALGRTVEGRPYLERAAALAPDSVDLQLDLGNLLQRVGAYPESEAAYRRLLAQQPDHAAALNNLGGVLRRQRRYAEAEAAYRAAMAAAPAYPDPAANLAGTLREQGRVEEAKTWYRRALALRSPWPEIHSNLVFCLDFDGEAGLEEQREERRRWREAIELPLAARARRHSAAPDPAKRLRIGYVSADFNRHSASDMFGAVLLNHDLQQLDVILYSNAEREDDRTAAFAAHATAFRRVRPYDDEALADIVQADGIDILVDLSGHSAHNRLPLFALRPAPVQVTAWGYATGTGLHSIDWFMADQRLVPEAMRPAFTERILELPCFLTYRAPDYLPDPGTAPCTRRGHVTFGNMNRLAKASDECLAVWAELLHRVPGSRLLLKCPSLDDPTPRQRILAQFAARGIGAERLDLRGATPHLEQLATYREIDIALDPFPHCGGTTTCEALSMGVPVVSLCGEVPVARNGYSLLNAIGCGEWVAFDRQAYLDIAVRLAADRDRIAALRGLLRDLVRASPLGDAAGYTRAVETAYRRIWVQHCIETRARAGGGAAG